MIVNPKNLHEAYEAYTKNQIMRRDMFRCIVEAVTELQASLNKIADGESGRQEAAKSIAGRLTSIEASLSELDDEIDTKVATAANSAVNILSAMNGTAGQQFAAKRVGRPPKSAAAEA